MAIALETIAKAPPGPYWQASQAGEVIEYKIIHQLCCAGNWCKFDDYDEAIQAYENTLLAADQLEMIGINEQIVKGLRHLRFESTCRVTKGWHKKETLWHYNDGNPWTACGQQRGWQWQSHWIYEADPPHWSGPYDLVSPVKWQSRGSRRGIDGPEYCRRCLSAIRSAT